VRIPGTVFAEVIRPTAQQPGWSNSYQHRVTVVVGSLELLRLPKLAICLSNVEVKLQKLYNTLRQGSQQLGRDGFGIRNEQCLPTRGSPFWDQQRIFSPDGNELRRV